MERDAVTKAVGEIPDELAEAFRPLLLDDPNFDGCYVAMTISMPGVTELMQDMSEVDPLLLYYIIGAARNSMTRKLRPEFEAALVRSELPADIPYDPCHEQAAKRAMKNCALGHLAALGEPEVLADCKARYFAASNFTDKSAALACLMSRDCPERQECLDAFEAEWKDNPLVMYSWLEMQASSNLPGNLERVKKLLEHPIYQRTNPNCVWALVSGFTASAVNFHAADGSGYAWYTEQILVTDKINNIIGGKMCNVYANYKQFDVGRQKLIKEQLEHLRAAEGKSNNLLEIVEKCCEM